MGSPFEALEEAVIALSQLYMNSTLPLGFQHSCRCRMQGSHNSRPEEASSRVINDAIVFF